MVLRPASPDPASEADAKETPAMLLNEIVADVAVPTRGRGRGVTLPLRFSPIVPVIVTSPRQGR
jgi:hypothetical protein